MTKENLTYISVILDASGSMAPLKNDTLGSFNSFINDQKLVPGEAIFTLCLFNTNSNIVYEFVDIANVKDITAKTYNTEGGTALLDAIGSTIDLVGKRLASLPEEERGSKVLFVIITDGEENSSHRYTAGQIKTMIQHQKDVYSHEFVFMGANIDAITAGTNLGISTNNTLNYIPTSAGTQQLYNTVSESMTSYRSAGVVRGASFFQPPVATQATVDLIDPLNNPVIQHNPVAVPILVPGAVTTIHNQSVKKTIK